MKTFKEYLQTILEGSYEDKKFILGPAEISELITDADDKGKLSDSDYDKLEKELNNIMNKVYQKYHGSFDGVDDFYKLANKAAKKYGLTIKQ